MTKRHKVFISYHHANDEAYRNKFERMMVDQTDGMVSRSVNIGDIPDGLKTETIRQKIRDQYLRDSTVTVVLIGTHTWGRKHVDWEISSSIRQTEFNPRSGLLGILLPSHPDYRKARFQQDLLPPRLVANVDCEFAAVYDWSDNPLQIQGWIHDAFFRRNTKIPDNSQDMFKKNRC